MKQKFPWLQSKSSGSFFFVLMAVLLQGDSYKVKQEDFLSRLLFDSIIAASILLIMVAVVHFSVAPSNLSAEKLEKLVKSQGISMSYSELYKLYLYSVLALSCFRYFIHKNETSLAWWNFLLSAAVSVSLGFLARWLSSYFLNRRIKASKQISSISHFSS